MQLGASGGRGVRDYCAVTEKLPELYTTAGSILANQQVASCAISEDWLTSIRGLASWTVPKIDVLISGSFRSDTWRRAGRRDRRQQRQLAGGELQRLERDPAGADGAPADAGPAAADRQPAAAGAHVPRYPQLARPAVRQEPAIRPDADERRNRPLQRVQQQHGNGYNQTYDPVTNGATWLTPTTVLNRGLRDSM